MDTANASVIEQRLNKVREKLLAGVPHAYIIQAGVQAWQCPENVMKWYIVFAAARNVQAAKAKRQRYAMVATLAAVWARRKVSA